MTTINIEIEPLCKRMRPRLPVWVLTSEIYLATLAPGFTQTAQQNPAVDEIPAGLDYSFTPQTKTLHLMSVLEGDPAVTSLALQADGKIVVAGASIIRLNPDGSRDIGFQERLHANGGVIGQVLVQTDGKILVSSRSDAGLIDLEQLASLVRLNADGSRDMSFHPDQSFTAVYAMDLDATGRILVVGYSDVESRVMWRLNSDGSLDPNFVTDSVPTEREAVSIAVQPDGHVLIAGLHEAPGGVAGRVTRLNPDGSLDLTFGSGTGSVGQAGALALQPDGHILLGGVTRLNSDGSPDADFDPGSGFDGGVMSVAVQADGRILVAGKFTTAAGQPGSGLVRLNPNGSLDSDFRPRIRNESGAPAEVLALQVQPDGRILIGGSFDSVNGARRYGIARLEPTPRQGINLGFADLTFRMSEDVGKALITVQRFGDPTVPVSVEYKTSSGTATAGKDYTEQQGTLTFGPHETAKTFTVPIIDNSLRNDNKTINLGLNQPTDGAALMPELSAATIAIYDNEQAGSVDLGFDASILGDLPRGPVAVQADGKVLTLHGFNVNRLNGDGTQDPSFNPDIEYRSVTSMLLQRDGKIVVGNSSIFGSETNVIVRRLNADGSSDQSFTPFAVTPTQGQGAAAGDVWAIQPDGKILLVIRTPPSPPTSPFVSTLRRLNADGSEDKDFKTYEFRYANALAQVAVSEDGRIILAGFFDTDSSLVRLNPDGTVDRTFKPKISASGTYSFALQHDGKLVLFGAYEDGASGGPGTFMRLNPDGSRDASFRSDVRVSGGAKFAMAPDGKIVALLPFGSVLTSGTARRTGVARLDTDGSLDEDFDVVPDFGSDFMADSADSIVVQPDGQILLAGHSIFGIVRLNGGVNYLKLTPMERLPLGPRRLGLIGRPGRTYTLEGSTDLRNWISVGTQTAASFAIEFEDADAVTIPQRIYRARLVQP